MGVTVFDLFNEIITRNDMVKFLSDNGITEKDYEGAALILSYWFNRYFNLYVSISMVQYNLLDYGILNQIERAFLLLLDLNKPNMENESDPVEVKIEQIETIENFGSEIDQFYNETDAMSDSSDNTHDVDSAPNRKRSKLQRGAKPIICRSPGCCGMAFRTRAELEAHYIEKSCFQCSECSEKFGSKRKLQIHVRNNHVPNVVVHDQLKSGMTCRISKCRKIFETVEARELHEAEFKHFQCEPCGIGFMKALELSKHRREDMCKGRHRSV